MAFDYNRDVLYCDNCGEPGTERMMYWIETLPMDVDSANAGESAVICKACFVDLQMQEALDNIQADISEDTED